MSRDLYFRIFLLVLDLNQFEQIGRKKEGFWLKHFGKFSKTFEMAGSWFSKKKSKVRHIMTLSFRTDFWIWERSFLEKKNILYVYLVTCNFVIILGCIQHSRPENYSRTQQRKLNKSNIKKLYISLCIFTSKLACNFVSYF